MRFMNVANGKYSFMKQIVKAGNSTAAMYGVPSFDSAYRAASKTLEGLSAIATNKL